MRLFAILLSSALIVPMAFAANDTETLPSGVTIQKQNKTSGAQPKASDQVKVHYRGTLETAPSSTVPTSAASRPGFRSRA